MAEEPQTDQQFDTQSVMNQLKGDRFPDADWANLLDTDTRDFFDTLIFEKGMQRSDIIRKAGISRTYGYQIMDGTRVGKRDYYLSIAFALGLDLRMAQRLLAVTKSGGLHPLIKRDAAIIFALNHEYDNDKLYEFLTELGLEPLDPGFEEQGGRPRKGDSPLVSVCPHLLSQLHLATGGFAVFRIEDDLCGGELGSKDEVRPVR